MEGEVIERRDVRVSQAELREAQYISTCSTTGGYSTAGRRSAGGIWTVESLIKDQLQGI